MLTFHAPRQWTYSAIILHMDANLLRKQPTWQWMAVAPDPAVHLADHLMWARLRQDMNACLQARSQPGEKLRCLSLLARRAFMHDQHHSAEAKAWRPGSELDVHISFRYWPVHAPAAPQKYNPGVIEAEFYSKRPLRRLESGHTAPVMHMPPDPQDICSVDDR